MWERVQHPFFELCFVREVGDVRSPMGTSTVSGKLTQRNLGVETQISLFRLWRFLFLFVRERLVMYSRPWVPLRCVWKIDQIILCRRVPPPPPPTPPPPTPPPLISFFRTSATFEAGDGPEEKIPVYAIAQHPQPAVQKSFPGPWKGDSHNTMNTKFHTPFQ